MEGVEWKFDRWPPEVQRSVIRLARGGEWESILRLHNEYNVSPNGYCGCNTDPIQQWVTWGINQNLIQGDDSKKDLAKAGHTRI